MCDTCCKKDLNDGCKICTKCSLAVPGPYATPRANKKVDDAAADEHKKVLDEALSVLKLKSRAKVLRKLETGEIKYDKLKKAFVYVEDDEKEFEVKNKDDDEYDDEEDIDLKDSVESADEGDDIGTKLENIDGDLDDIDNEKIDEKIQEVAVLKNTA